MPIVVLLEDGNFVKEYDYTTLDESEVRDFLLGNTTDVDGE
jgi:hypothetical protein